MQHILTDTEENANKIVAELDKGADFTKLVLTSNRRSRSTVLTEGLTPNGGVIDWFAERRVELVEPFVTMRFRDQGR